MGKNKILFYMRIVNFKGGSLTGIVRQTKQNAATLGESLVAVGAPLAVVLRYALPRLRRGWKEQKNALHKDIFMGGSHARIVGLAKQIAATLGVSLVVLGLPWGPLWLWVCKMPFKTKMRWDRTKYCSS